MARWKLGGHLPHLEHQTQSNNLSTFAKVPRYFSQSRRTLIVTSVLASVVDAAG